VADTAADVIVEALTHHRWGTAVYSRIAGPTRIGVCTCGARDLAMSDRWEAHLADVTVAALTQAGLLGMQPIVTRTDVMPEARWRAAALGVVAAWTHQPIPGTDVAAVQQEDLDHRWPSLGAAIRRLVHAKAQLLEGKP
jgi:hypothetical protein